MSSDPNFLNQFHMSISGPTEAPKLVFLHGVMGFALNWRRIAKAFEGEYQTLAFDQRGHGRSFQPAAGYAPENYADDLHGILDALGWTEVRLVGHSMGGRAALQFASQYPKRLTQLVIEDIGPSQDPSTASLVLRMLDAVPVPFATKREAKIWFDRDFMEIFKHERHPEGLAGYLYANLTENDQGEAVWRFSEAGIRESVAQGRAKDRWRDFEALSVPTLVIRGEQSGELSRNDFGRMLASNPRVRGVEVAGAGHWVHSDRPDRFIEILRGFFLDHFRRQTSVN